MNSKKVKIIYLVSTILLSLLMVVGSAGNYIFNHEVVSEIFTALGFPTYLIYPMAIAKILGVIALWNKKYPTLKEWAYAGFFFNLVLALIAHIGANDGEFLGAVIGIVLLFASYFSEKKIKNKMA